jgi:hypothetical protein
MHRDDPAHDPTNPIDTMAALATAFTPLERAALQEHGLLHPVGERHLPVGWAVTPEVRAATLPLLAPTLVWSGRTAAWIWTGIGPLPPSEVTRIDEPRARAHTASAAAPRTGTHPGTGTRPQDHAPRPGTPRSPRTAETHPQLSERAMLVRRRRMATADVVRLGNVVVTTPGRTVRDLAVDFRDARDAVRLDALAGRHRDAVTRTARVLRFVGLSAAATRLQQALLTAQRTTASVRRGRAPLTARHPT